MDEVKFNKNKSKAQAIAAASDNPNTIYFTKESSTATTGEIIVNGVSYGSSPDLSGYALKTEVPSITGLASETWVTQQGFIKDVSDKLDVTTYENNNITVAASLNDLHDQLIWEDEE